MTSAGYRRITNVIIIVTIAALIAWDVVAEFGGGDPATISGILVRVFYRHPMVTFATGALLGHLTWPRARVWSHRTHAILVAASLVVVAVLDRLHVVPPVLPLLPLLLGIPYGHAIWAQATAMQLAHSRSALER